MTRDSDAFEQQIQRIHELLEDFCAEVTWNDHIPDPDNPSQPRQIDVTVKRDGKLALIECRQHASRQDVQWIEELIGRRASIAPDATMIAVSSSGFTRGALKKADRFGIITHDIRCLTDLEIKSWGRQMAVTMYFYEYSDLQISLLFKEESIPKLDSNKVRSEFESYPGVQSLFNLAAKQLDTQNPLDAVRDQFFRFGLRCDLPDLRLCGEPVLEVGFRGKACIRSMEFASSIVQGYQKPIESAGHSKVTVESFPLAGTSIVHEAGRISVFLDLSQLNLPPVCQFRFVRFVGELEMEYESFELASPERLWIRADVPIEVKSQ